MNGPDLRELYTRFHRQQQLQGHQLGGLEFGTGSAASTPASTPTLSVTQGQGQEYPSGVEDITGFGQSNLPGRPGSASEQKSSTLGIDFDPAVAVAVAGGGIRAGLDFGRLPSRSNSDS